MAFLVPPPHFSSSSALFPSQLGKMGHLEISGCCCPCCQKCRLSMDCIADFPSFLSQSENKGGKSFFLEAQVKVKLLDGLI